MTSQSNCTIYSEKASLKEKFSDIFSLHGEADKGFISTLQGPDKRQRTYHVKDLAKVLDSIDLEQNSYYTLNRFFSFSRKKIHCSKITCLYSDLDTYKTEFKDLPIEEILELVLKECEKHYFPAPTSAMFSGRGLQLKWVFTEAETANFTAIKRFEESQDAIRTMLHKFGADEKSKDLSRVFRIQGSLHFEAKTYTRMMFETQNTFKLNRLHVLLDALIPEPVVRIVKEKKPKPVKAPKIKVEKIAVEKPEKNEMARTRLSLAVNNTKTVAPTTFVKKGLLSLNTQRFLDLKRLIKMRGNVSGERMVFLAWIMNFKALSGQVTVNNFLDQAKIEGDLLFGSDTYNLNEMITVLNKFKAQLNDEKIEFNGRSYLPLYTPKNRTLINIFQITPDEQKGLKTIIDDEEKEERHRVREMQRRRDNGAVSREEYLANSVESSKPWEILKISRRTYYTRKKQGLYDDNSVALLRAVN